MDATNHSETEVVLHEWRTKILNVLLTVVAAAAGIILVVAVLDAISRPSQWPTVGLAGVLVLMLAALAVFRRIDSRIRAWGIMLVPYAIALTGLASYGLGGSGRIYLLVLPIGALILIGVRASVLMSAISALTMAVFAYLAHQGLLGQWLTEEPSSLLLADWIGESVRMLGVLAVIMVPLILFYRFQERTIAQERHARAELTHAQELLEQQNATLEQRVEERTAELAEAVREAEEARSAAQESQRRMADIIDFLPDAALVIDREGRVIAWNHAIEEMTGVKADDILGKGDQEYALPFYGQRRPILIDLVTVPQEEMEQKYAHIQRHGSILAGETYVPSLRGSAHYLMATASVLRDTKGRIEGAIEVIRDITDRKRAEEELREAKAAAESATQAKSAFLATMSHEIRTPMNAVIGMTSLLLDTPLSPEQREFAETIRTSGDALLTIINDILDFSKIEAGRVELESVPFDVRECLEGAVGLVAGQAAAKGLELGCWIDPGVPAGIAGDETRLRQIVLNLMSNAVKFTEKGEVVANVALDDGPPQDDTRTWLHISVRDTGLGIPADRMDRLFQSFSQVDTSTTRRFGGTGLGLAISHRLAELMGGQLWAESAGIPGQGSTFHLTVPAQPAPVPSRAELQAEAADLRGRRVLIVDDNATNRRILALQTEAWGMQVLATGSGEEALSWLRRGDPFDVAVIDRLMPEIDGLMLAAEMRKLRDADALPLVMASSLGSREEGPQGEPFAAFLLKPIRASQLYDALVGILSSEAHHVRRTEEPAQSAFDAGMGVRLPLSILLAEDHPVNQKLALLMLKRLGYRADLAANGLEVLEALERQHYDVVLMDVQMPEMDGLEATRQICRWPQGARPRIIAMTANALQEDREACFAAGMDDYLGKPIRVEELVAALSRSQPQAGSAPETPELVAPAALPGLGAPPSAEPEGMPEVASPLAELDRGALDNLLALVGGEPALLGELIDSYLQETPKLLDALRHALEEGNPAALRQAAHPLKSSSRDFGAIQLSEWARELEEMGRVGTLDGAPPLVALVEVEYPRVKAALAAVQSGRYPGRDAA